MCSPSSARIRSWRAIYGRSIATIASVSRQEADDGSARTGAKGDWRAAMSHRRALMAAPRRHRHPEATVARDRKSTRLNSSHRCISYAVFCLKKKNKQKAREHDAADDSGRDGDGQVRRHPRKGQDKEPDQADRTSARTE